MTKLWRRVVVAIEAVGKALREEMETHQNTFSIEKHSIGELQTAT